METALITGASGGIGLELAHIFASHHINLVLVARNEPKLNELATELSAKGINVNVFATDLSKLENAQKLYDFIINQNLEIQYLINNVGFGIAGAETEILWERELEMLNLNIVTLSWLTKSFAKDMVARKSGRIMNVGSIGSFQPGPFMAGYCATKAYVLHFSEAVNEELKGTGVSVTTLCPGVTDTGFHQTANTMQSAMYGKLAHASAREVAEYGFRLMMKRKSSGVYGWMNKVSTFSVRITPRNLVTKIAAKLMQ